MRIVNNKRFVLRHVVGPLLMREVFCCGAAYFVFCVTCLGASPNRPFDTGMIDSDSCNYSLLACNKESLISSSSSSSSSRIRSKFSIVFLETVGYST
jgi:hypothetical protein